jgi:hypothetical protein
MLVVQPVIKTAVKGGPSFVDAARHGAVAIARMMVKPATLTVEGDVATIGGRKATLNIRPTGHDLVPSAPFHPLDVIV